jgi:hypothetical protein
MHFSSLQCVPYELPILSLILSPRREGQIIQILSQGKLHFIFTVHLFIIELFVPTNALRQFFHCFLYYKDAQIRISAIILPSSGGILSEFLHRPILCVTS